MDYDGPNDSPYSMSLHFGADSERRFVKTIAKESNNYRVVNYSYFPGSLGNFAGYELKIATITLELETTKPELVKSYWKQFSPGFIKSINYNFVTKMNTKTPDKI